MTGSHSALPALPLRLTPLQILGLRNPSEGDWAQLRALQYSQLHKASLTRVVAHGLALLITISVYHGKVPVLLLGAWLAAAIPVLEHSHA